MFLTMKKTIHFHYLKAYHFDSKAKRKRPLTCRALKFIPGHPEDYRYTGNPAHTISKALSQKFPNCRILGILLIDFTSTND